MPADSGPHGWLVIDKPTGIASSRAVALVRRVTGAKAGHAGTLDPLASGVLPVALGEATKTVAYAMGSRKRYRFAIRWGVARNSDDREGEIVGETAMRPDREAVEAVLPRFIGTLEQRPPAYSAVKLGGRRAYALARAGLPPMLPPRRIEIAALRLTGMPDRDTAWFEATVGKGTYIRALARDLAAALGTLGHVADLRRLSVGPFTEERAISLEAIGLWHHIDQARAHLLPIETPLAGIPALDLPEAEATRLRFGQLVMPSDPEGRAYLDSLDRGTVIGAWHACGLIALARTENGGLRPFRVINR